MDPFLLALILGGTGLLAMALAGFGSHSGGHASHHAGGLTHGHHDVSLHGGHAHDVGQFHGTGAPHAGAGVHAGHSHAGVSHAGHSHAADQRDSFSHSSAWSWLSPRTLFSVLVGMGAVGLVLRPVLGTLITLPIAFVGGLGFEAGLVRPLWNQLFKFESAPAQTLESAIMSEGRAVTGFDATGHGLVSIELGGEIVQLLAALTPEERSAGVRIHAGDQLRIEDVDGKRNRCTVSRIGLT